MRYLVLPRGSSVNKILRSKPGAQLYSGVSPAYTLKLGSERHGALIAVAATDPSASWTLFIDHDTLQAVLTQWLISREIIVGDPGLPDKGRFLFGFDAKGRLYPGVTGIMLEIFALHLNIMDDRSSIIVGSREKIVSVSVPNELMDELALTYLSDRGILIS